MTKRFLSYWKNVAKKAESFADPLRMKLPSPKHVELIGVPWGEIYPENEYEDPFNKTISAFKPELVVIGVDSSEYLDRFKTIGKYICSKDLPLARTESSLGINELGPGNWQDLTLHFPLFDILEIYNNNKSFVDQTAFRLFSPHDMEKREIEPTELNKMVFSEVFGKQFPRHIYLYNAVLLAAVNDFDIILGDIPENLFRLKLMHRESLENLKDMFQKTIEAMNEHYSQSEELIAIEDFAYREFPEVFLSPKVEYTTALIQEVSEDSNTAAFLGMDSAIALADSWNSQLLFNEVKKQPLFDEDQDRLIEKQALLDVFLGRKAWGGKYRNKFPFIKDWNDKHTDKFYKSYASYVNILMEKAKAPDEAFN